MKTSQGDECKGQGGNWQKGLSWQFLQHEGKVGRSAGADLAENGHALTLYGMNERMRNTAWTLEFKGLDS